MATGQYIGVNGVARKVTAPYVGVEGVARKVTAGYVGVNGVARLFFAPESGNVVLEVEKITSNTYANETTYENEEFILLDIYPKTGGTVNVTYGGLTKTITDTSGVAEPNAQQVFFGTFNGVTDSVATPSSGELTIEGDYRAIAQSGWSRGKFDVAFCAPIPCVTKIVSLGKSELIPAYAFSGCTGLTSVTIPASVTTIGGGAFSNCTGLTSIEVDSRNEHYSSDGGILFNKDKTEICAYPSVTGHYTIPASVTTIGAYAFSGCTGLTSVTIPASVTTIGGGTFSGCTGLTSVTIPASVTTIGGGAFSGCTGLTSVTIPASVTYMYGCFGNTSETLENVIMLATTPPTLNVGTTVLFSANAITTITVPKGCGDVYKAAEVWRNYADKIVEAS